MPQPYSSVRWTQMFLVTPGSGPITGPTLPQRNAPKGNITTIYGFMVDVAGTVTFETAEHSEVISGMPVQPGIQYYIECKRIISVTGVTKIWGAR